MNHEPVSIAGRLERVRSVPSEPLSIPPAAARRVLLGIFLINAFERAVIELKRHDCVWGPIHISIGQEAVAAAAMAALQPGDRITGSHRAHHITLAKILEHVLPRDWDPAPGASRPSGGGVKLPEPAREAVYRTLAEIMGLADGYCGGRGGSMHLRHAEAGVLGTNAIVGGGVPLSVGAALAAKRLGTGAVVAAFMGDGAVNQGSFHESCNMASLWKLPVIFVVENNQYAVAPSVHDATATDELVRLAAAYDMDGYQVPGHDVQAIYTVFDQVAGELRAGGRPVLVEVQCYRHFHHGGDLPGSRYGYRRVEEEQEWLDRDACTTYPLLLERSGIADRETVGAIRLAAEQAVADAVAGCTEGDPPRVRGSLWPAPESVSEGVRSNGRELERLPYAPVGHPAPGAGRISLKYSDAIAAVIGRWLEKDPSVFVLGEEVANFGSGAYGATRGLPDRFPGRLVNTPISEGGFCGIGLGAAMSGLKPIIEIMFPDFTLVAADQVFNQIGKARHMYGNTTDLPLVVRTRVATGCGYGGQHSMDPVGLYALFSGWRIVAPADAYEYVGLFNTAMHSLDPVLVLEHHALYGQSADLPHDDLDYCIPFGTARRVREGGEITVAVYGSMVGRLEAIAEELSREGIGVDLLDLRTLDLASLDFASVGESLAKTGVLAVVEQAAAGQAIGQRIASVVSERFFDDLDAPIGVLASLDVPNPVSRALEQAAMLGDDEITATLRDMARRRWR